MNTGHEMTHYRFLILDKGGVSSAINMISVLQEANILAGRKRYSYSCTNGYEAVLTSISNDPGPKGIDNLFDDKTDFLVVAGTEGPKNPLLDRFSGLFRKYVRHGGVVIGVGSGALYLAAAGLLDDMRATIDWRLLDHAQSLFTGTDWNICLYEETSQVITCAGHAATFHLMLNRMHFDHGVSFAKTLVSVLHLDRIRDGYELQTVTASNWDRKLDRAVHIMRDTVMAPLTLEEVADQSFVSRRHLERLFRRYLGVSPGRYYINLRLHQARVMLQYTSKSITEIAFATGFRSLSHFSRCYRDHYGLVPSEERTS